MASTVIRGAQILNNTVQRQDLDTSTVGQAVVTKLVQGSGISLSSTGADSGTGDVTVSSPDVVSTDAGNIAVLGTDNHILVPQSQIWSVRLRSFNAVGNPTFEVDQRSAGGLVTNPSGGVFILDRWSMAKSGTMAANWQQNNAGVVVPNTNFFITRSFLRCTLTTQEASLAAGDLYSLAQVIEGPRWRELCNDVTSLSLLVRSSVAGLKFGASIRDPAGSSLTKLCTTSASANTWTLVQLPNLPQGGGFATLPGSQGLLLNITLASGTTYMSPANDTWQSGGNFVGAPGQSNFCASPINSTWDIAYIGHEPAAVCSTPQDCSFGQNLDGDMGCLRYFQKSYPYGTAPGTVTSANATQILSLPSQHPYCWIPFKKTMAKTPPTIVAWSPASGSSNAVRNSSNSVDLASTGPMNMGDAGFGGFTVTGPPAANWIGSFHYTADTGW